MTPPRVESRTIEDFSREIRRALAPYPKEDKASNYNAVGGPGRAFVEVMARYAELIADRLNQVPDKLMLAYLDLLGASLRPPEPARVPLTFSLVNGARSAFVKRGTQVEATPSPGDQEPVVFETEADVTLTGAVLDSVFWKDPVQDEYADLSAVSSQPFAAGVPVFGTSYDNPGVRIPHELWLGVHVPENIRELDSLRFRFRTGAGPRGTRTVLWESLGEKAWIPVTPEFDTTAGFAKSGDVLFTGWTPEKPQTVSGRTAHWFRCRWPDPVTRGSGAIGTPILESVVCALEVRESGSPPQAVYFDELLDPTREMWVLGAKPLFGSTFHLRHDDAFGVAGAIVTIQFDLLNPADATGEQPVPLVRGVATRLRWEAWDGSNWVVLGTSQAGAVTRDTTTGWEDTTEALTKAGHVRLRVPEKTWPVLIAGQSGYWIRVRMVSGDYGREATYEQGASGGNVFTPASFAPPVVRQILLSFQFQAAAQAPFLFRHNDFHLEDITGALPQRPFLPVAEVDSDPAVYLGFALAFADQSRSTTAPGELSLYLEVQGGGAVSGGQGMEVSWERFDRPSGRWVPLPVRDQTFGMTRSGTVRSVAAFPQELHGSFGVERLWIRVRPVKLPAKTPILLAALLNTVPALHVTTTEKEIVGSGNSKPSQTVRTARAPVLEGQQLQVLEAVLPSATERAAIMRDEGSGAIQPTEPGQGPGAWIRWHEVPDFRVSGPRDRHYTIERLTGIVLFGDGAHGLAPPAGTSNIRMRTYRTGGGSRGNKPTETVVNLKSAVPFIDRVSNRKPASGGSDTENLAQLRIRFPRELRHGNRAVTPEDYEDLAQAASRQVLRAKCVPLYDLGADPAGERRSPGTVSVVILPRSTDLRPIADSQLLAIVEEYLRERQPPEVRVVIVSPEYVRIDIVAEIAVTSLASRSEVEAKATDTLQRFLHPCTGQEGEGWGFGRMPKHSDIYAVLEAIPEVEYVSLLRIDKVPERAGAGHAERFVIYCGESKVTARVGA